MEPPSVHFIIELSLQLAQVSQWNSKEATPIHPNIESTHTLMNGQHIVLAGGRGFLGQSLMRALIGRGYAITVLTRSENQAADTAVRYVTWDACSLGKWTDALEGADALVNFSGKNVNCRLTKRNRRELLSSRRDAAIVLGDAVKRCRRPPHVFVQCSAVGFYGDTDSCCDEQTPGGSGILAEIVKTCEAAFHDSELKETRKVLLRLGVVIGKSGGALTPLATLTRCFLGGAAGSGKQYLSWIHMQDLNRIIIEVFGDSTIEGTFNAVSPSPVTNAEFMRTLRKVLRKPWSPPVPGLLLRTVAFVLGFNSELILTGQQCVPRRLQEADFQFEFSPLGPALRDLLGAS